MTEQESFRSAYDKIIRESVESCYSVAKRVRALGKDVREDVEMPLASDMADRIEELIGIRGIAEEIRKQSVDHTREEVSISISRLVARMYSNQGPRMAVDKAVRVGLAILTEGILVAPLEGIADVSIDSNDDGSNYVSVSYSGPIRGAGGTAQALSVLIADIVRRDLGIGSYRATDEEVERYIEEVQSYNRLKHLQYFPSPEEIRTVITNSPVCIDGEGSEEEEISGHRDMKRVKTNRIRGGMCLVLCEGLIQKSKKILKHTAALGISDWNFLARKEPETSETEVKVSKNSDKYLKDMVAGRPVFSHPGAKGGFRLRYGRSRVSGLAATSMNPSTMYILGKFIAIGCQLKMEAPGKAAAITPCDSVEGPTVLLKNGDHIRVDSLETAKEIYDDIVEITDVGEMLISFGDFLENNHVLEKPSYTPEWWRINARVFPDLVKYQSTVPEEAEAWAISRKFPVPLYPEFDLIWNDITMEEFTNLRSDLLSSEVEGSGLLVRSEESVIRTLIKLNCQFRSLGTHIIPKYSISLLRSMGLDIKGERVVEVSEPGEYQSPLEAVNSLSGIVIKDRAPTRIGSRMGRPEKAGDRKMKPMVHVLFPIENYGDARRSIVNAGRKSDENGIEIEAAVRECLSCGLETPHPLCPKCGSRTQSENRTGKMRIDLSELIDRAERRTGISVSSLKELKGVKKLMSKDKVSEPLEKGLFRAKHGVSTNKDGTCRYDLTDIPITHFRKDEIGISSRKLVQLGYEDKDINEIQPQDIIIPRDAAKYLIRVTQYVDDLLINYYNTEPFYLCEKESDLIGQLVIGLAPHTSGGIAGRIIGFSDVNGCYAHPFFHAAKRRNCDGDEDSIMLLMDGLINFSKDYLPSTRGGLMDAPLVLTVRLNPDEVDKEALNVDTLWEYPLEFYQAAEQNMMPSKIESLMKTMKILIQETGSFRGTGYSLETADISSGIKISSYKTILSMQDKIEQQLGLARRIRAVDENDVAARVLSSHFLPDMYGNFRGFFSQEFRCTKCNTKYRRVPLSGRCFKCGNSSINLTIHKGSIIKYMDETLKVSHEFQLPWYLNMRIENIINTITQTFNIDKKEEDKGLEDYQEIES